MSASPLRTFLVDSNSLDLAADDDDWSAFLVGDRTNCPHIVVVLSDGVLVDVAHVDDWLHRDQMEVVDGLTSSSSVTTLRALFPSLRASLRRSRMGMTKAFSFCCSLSTRERLTILS